MCDVFHNEDLMNIINSYKEFTPETKDDLKKAVVFYYENTDAGIKKYGVMNSWNVSKITDMSRLFEELYDFNEYINDWDVSKLTHLESLKFCDADWE